MIGLERNQQGENPNVTTVRVLKNRYSGDTGLAGWLEYQKGSGRSRLPLSPLSRRSTMTSEVCFDIETNAIDNFQTLEGLEAIHCIGVSNLNGEATELYGPDRIEEGLAFLAEQDVVYGHNVVGFDIPAIQKLYPQWRPKGLVRDTMIMGRMAPR